MAFHAFYVAGAVWPVSLPALRRASRAEAGLNGAILGALAFGTWEFTNISMSRGWDCTMVATDTARGTILASACGAAGVWVVRETS